LPKFLQLNLPENRLLERQPNVVLERHDRINEENGPYIANGAMHSLRAVYSDARKSNADLLTLIF